MNCYEGGYVDQLRGACKEAMLVGEGRDASAYRAGARTCRADVEAEREHFENTATSGYIVPDPTPVPEWRRRLTEFRDMVSKSKACPGVEITNTMAPSIHTASDGPDDLDQSRLRALYPDEYEKEDAARTLPKVEHEVEVKMTPTGFVAVADSKPILPVTPNAFADPVPGAKKRKAKPVDADQGSLFG